MTTLSTDQLSALVHSLLDEELPVHPLRHAVDTWLRARHFDVTLRTRTFFGVQVPGLFTRGATAAPPAPHTPPTLDELVAQQITLADLLKPVPDGCGVSMTALAAIVPVGKEGFEALRDKLGMTLDDVLLRCDIPHLVTRFGTDVPRLLWDAPFHFRPLLYAKTYATRLKPRDLQALRIELGTWLTADTVMDTLRLKVADMLKQGTPGEWAAAGLVRAHVLALVPGARGNLDAIAKLAKWDVAETRRVFTTG